MGGTLIFALFVTTFMIPCESRKIYYIKEHEYVMSVLKISDIDRDTTVVLVPSTTFDYSLTEAVIKLNNLTHKSYGKLARLKNADWKFSVGIGPRSLKEIMFWGKNIPDYLAFNDVLRAGVSWNGQDIFTVVKEAPEYIWIWTLATDNKLDILELPTESFEVSKIDKIDNSIAAATKDDLVLCYYDQPDGPKKFVILKNYNIDDNATHLMVMTSDDDMYMVIPERWLGRSNHLVEHYYVDDFNDLYSLEYSNPLPFNMPIMSDDKFPIFAVHDNKCTFYLRKNTIDPNTTYMFINDGRGKAEAMKVRLVYLLDDDNTLTEKWRNKFFLIVYDNGAPRKILTLQELLPTLNN